MSLAWNLRGSSSCRVVRLPQRKYRASHFSGQSSAAPSSDADQELLQQGTGTLRAPGGVAYLGMGWDVGTTGTNLGQLAICSWTFMQEETCTLILASVT